jgi:hypothetical protein
MPYFVAHMTLETTSSVVGRTFLGLPSALIGTLIPHLAHPLSAFGPFVTVNATISAVPFIFLENYQGLLILFESLANRLKF